MHVVLRSEASFSYKASQTTPHPPGWSAFLPLCPMAQKPDTIPRAVFLGLSPPVSLRLGIRADE